MSNQLNEVYGKLYQETNILRTMVQGLERSLLGTGDSEEGQKTCIQSLQTQFSRVDSAIMEISTIIGERSVYGMNTSNKEYSNYLSQFYGNGSAAENLPASKRVYTEAEMQRALSMALLQNGIRKHLDIQDCLNTDVINDTCLDTKNQETEKNLHPVVPGRDDLRFNSEGFLSSEGKQLVRNKKGELCRPE